MLSQNASDIDGGFFAYALVFGVGGALVASDVFIAIVPPPLAGVKGIIALLTGGFPEVCEPPVPELDPELVLGLTFPPPPAPAPVFGLPALIPLYSAVPKVGYRIRYITIISPISIPLFVFFY